MKHTLQKMGYDEVESYEKFNLTNGYYVPEE